MSSTVALLPGGAGRSVPESDGRRLRIAVIAPPWLPVPPGRYGGTEAVIDRLARGYRAAGHDVILCATAESRCPVPHHPSPETTVPTEIGASAPELCHTLDAYEAVAGADVVHDHTIVGALAAAPLGQRVVVTHHGPFDHRYRRIFEAIARRAAVVAISHAQAAGAVPGSVTGIIHHGIDVRRVPVGPGDGGYLAYLGRFHPTKGAREAVAIARRAGAPLRIAAKCREPAEQEYFEAFVRPHLGGDIEYVGELDEADKYRLLGGAAALLNPIRWAEPFGLVMIEALAAGTPVLAPPLGAVPEIVDHGVTGWVAPAEDLGRHIGLVAFLDRAACRRAVEARFTTERMVADHLRLFHALLDRDGRRRLMTARPS
jgi:glycosyltransferase involved in cell wall biosynthesis